MSLTNWKLDLTIDLKAHGLAPKAEVDRLTRERDEAQAAARLADFKAEAADIECVRLRATQSSPEVLELVNATKALVAYWREVYPTGTCGVRTDERIRVEVAHDALAAVERKAEPKARYEFVASSGGWQEGGMVRDIRTQELVFGSWRGICDDNSLAAFHKARCEAECARLNASDAAGRKS